MEEDSDISLTGTEFNKIQSEGEKSQTTNVGKRKQIEVPEQPTILELETYKKESE